MRVEGVLVAKKDFNAPKHEELDVPNLQVIKALQSLTSKGYVKTQFSWQWYYYVLTPEGVEYLREWCVRYPHFSYNFFMICWKYLGYTSLLKSSPLHIKRLPAHNGPPQSAQEEAKVHTVHRAVIGTITERRKVVPPASSGHSLLVLVGVLQGSKCYWWGEGGDTDYMVTGSKRVVCICPLYAMFPSVHSIYSLAANPTH